ncbi:ATP-binding protein [Vibrio furnissii]|uniref:ATP-binding protein n=1 Tax=Vibrio furnissii TaxID=29494 RepID=UPI001EEAECFF|nr:ATP-binding protein [Vibrio furnissii]MCG6211329.1 ATP-binding protein [Vibrio furnissii]
MVNDILDFSKLEAQQLELDSVKCYLLHEIGELLRVHCTAAREKSLDFHVNWTPGRVKTVIVDSLRLRQIINNLLSNAIKFTQSGFVSVDIDVTERDMVMNISDSGEGMSPEFLKTVFDPFVQADSTIARRYGGTGLGLAIVHDLVKVMKGDITIDSEQGKGTSIQVTIPIQVESYFKAPLSETPVHYHGSHPLIEQWLRAWGVKAENNAASGGIDVYDDGQTVSNDRPRDMTVILRNNMNGFSLRANNVVELSVSPFFPDLLRNVLKNVSDNEPDEEVVTGQLVGHILVAEDNPINQLVISRQLASFGLSVEVVSNGQEAYDQIKNHPDHFDLLLTDCHMPVMDGYQLASLVRDHFPQFSNKAIIGCTAEDSRVANERALLSGFDTVLYKPYGLNRLYQILAEFLPNRSDESESSWWQAYEPQDAKMLVEVFISSMQDDLGSLLSQRMDPKQVKSLAHRIKGGAGTVGEHDIRLAAEHLEQCASRGAQAYETELDQLVQIMTSAIHRAEEWLHEH